MVAWASSFSKRDAPLIDDYGFSAPCDYGGAGILNRFSPSLSPLVSLSLSCVQFGVPLRRLGGDSRASTLSLDLARYNHAAYY